MQKKTDTITLPNKRTVNPTAATSVRIYAEEFARACKRVKVDPRIALVETDDYPKLMRCDQVEFMVGYLHGCAETHEVTPLALWDSIFPVSALAPRVAELKAAWFGKKSRVA
jgi:hypothetical protein